ncbi:MAG: ribonuclease R [Alphaproteobacteria bacterium]|nr:ribonuclease R [Alphaproteobacteria bacterium]
MVRAPRRATLPDKEAVRQFIENSPGKVGKREIVRAFGLTGAERIGLKTLLKQMAGDGLIARSGRRGLGMPGRLPSVATIEITGLDQEGGLVARPLVWEEAVPPPAIAVQPSREIRPALAVGDRLLARLAPDGAGYRARPIRRIERAPERLLGVLSQSPEGWRLTPASRKDRGDYRLAAADLGGALAGELVEAEVLPGRRLGPRAARVRERVGSLDNPRALSLIALHQHEIPREFAADALRQARHLPPAGLAGREDLRDLPFVTIDGEDARDFDDAVLAEVDSDAANPGGFWLWVAIADVAHYVRAGSALDREALKRGNSVYFPDRVVPMLPERLSNDLCSLREAEDRPVLVARLRFDAAGHKREHRFLRAVIRSSARLTYAEVQAAADGRPSAKLERLRERVLAPLLDAHASLYRARRRRGPLELELSEMQVHFDKEGEVSAIRPRPRYLSHRLIEDCMIAANVAAAEALEDLALPCMYRIHAAPDAERVRGLARFLASLDLKFSLGESLRPRLFNRVLEQVDGGQHRDAVNQAVLRTQAQAEYSPDNIGHFGLALRRYAHFTSPIRRYADLLVHRALIRGLGLGEGGLEDAEALALARVAERISAAERRAMAAERDAVDRFVAAYMAERIGQDFVGRIAGVNRAGLFVRLQATGADGFVPISSLGSEYFSHVEAEQSLVGSRSGRRYRLGDEVEVRLLEAVPVTGGLLFQLQDGGRPPARQPARPGAARRQRRR